jgi:hypothetical protein
MKLQKIAKIYRECSAAWFASSERLAHNRGGRGPRPGNVMTAARFGMAALALTRALPAMQ